MVCPAEDVAIDQYLVVIPAFNEEHSIASVIRPMVERGFGVLVIDDGSHDQTALCSEVAGASVVRHCVNLGYGSALLTGYKYAVANSYAGVLQLDGDGQHDPVRAIDLLLPLQNGEADVILGSRFLDAESYQVPRFRRMGQEFYRFVIRFLTGMHITDPTTGCQALSGSVLHFLCRHPFPDDFPDANILLILHRKRFRIIEKPLRMFASQGKSMHQGVLKPVYYLVKMTISIFLAMTMKLH
ncbi:MAG: glycosyltransferase family 2 protein [Magnetococcales bacterium]|nr:glycosyltransferase family 2 protein [Magnetococcales bacterium]